MNNAPVISGTPAPAGQEGVAYAFQAAASDTDGDAVTWSLTLFPAGMTMAAGLVEWTPATGDAGDHAITLSASDGTAMDELSWTITVAPPDSAPVITSSAASTAVVDRLYSYQVVATGYPAPVISVDALTLPGWLIFDGTDTLSGTPDTADLGTTGMIAVTASNGISPGDTEQLTIEVLPVWTIEVIDDVGDVGYDSVLALDSSGNVHAAYYDADNAELKYTTNDSGTWATPETVDSTDDVGYHTSIAIDSTGAIHIAYYDDTNAHLKHAIDSGTGWIAEVVDSTLGTGTHASLAIGPGDVLHVCYVLYSASDLYYVTKPAAGAWSTPALVDSAQDVGKHASVAVDSTGMVYVAYYDSTSMDLKYAYLSGTTWTTGVIDGTGDVGEYASLAIDGSDKLHVAYYDATNDDLKYANNTTGAWDFDTVDATGDVGNHASLALDSGGAAHIAYLDYTGGLSGGLLRYATNAGGAWAAETVDDTASAGFFASIVIGANDKPHMVYRDGTNTAIKYARGN